MQQSKIAHNHAMNATAKNVALLSACQALLFTNNVTLIAINGLAGYALAPSKALATMTVTTQILGSALATMPASNLMHRIGRRAGFQVGTLFGVVGALIATLAIALGNFWLLCFGTFVLGAYGAFGGFYRFAAADAAEPAFRPRAISLVVAGGLVGGLIGPALSTHTRALTQPEFLASYASLIVFSLLTMLVLTMLDIPKPAASSASSMPRALGDIAKQPAFFVAVLSSGVGYGVMNLLMTATPLAMGFCGHPYGAAASVIAAHVIAMFAPSFVTGSIISRFGVLNVIGAGIALMFCCVGVALAGIDIANFWWALVLLGVGWNFMYVGGSTLLTESYRVEEKAKAQGAHDLIVFCTMATSSFASGVLVNRAGWVTLQWTAVPFLIVCLGVVMWLMARRRGTVVSV
jgi:MFS family permease